MLKKLKKIKNQWLEIWPQALLTWSPYINLREPDFLFTEEDVKKVGISNLIAAVSMADLGIKVDLKKIIDLGLEDFGLIILAHEIGHHVLCPNSVMNMAILINLINPIFGNIEQTKIMENLYGDLFINDRLYTSRNLPINKLYKQMIKNEAQIQLAENLWKFYMRVYETLWSLPRGSLAGSKITKKMDLDAGIASRIIRIYANCWIKAAKKIAYVFQPYFPPMENVIFALMPNIDIELEGEGAERKIYGLTYIDEDELEAENDKSPFPVDPALLKQIRETKSNTDIKSTGQYRTPAQYGQIINNLGLKLSPDEILINYYRELAGPELIQMPKIKKKGVGDFFPEGIEVWTSGEDIETIDWHSSIFESPIIFPNLTTKKRIWAEGEGSNFDKLPIDLDIYIDSSGSMPNPSIQISYLTLSGVILALSAIRAGAKAQATVWSGYGQFASTYGYGGFINDEKTILKILVQYFGNNTGFPLNVLRDTYKERKSGDQPVHIIIISDEGVDTMLFPDEKNIDGEKISKEALYKARGGGTLLLNLPSSIESYPKLLKLKDLGYEIYRLTNWAELVIFARDFSVKQYGDI